MLSRNSRPLLATLSLMAALATALLTSGGWRNSDIASATYPQFDPTLLAGVDSQSGSQTPQPTKEDARVNPAYRFTQDSWTYVHLEGSPRQVGFQHGYLLQPEIDD